jgi:hypothetical protein
VHVHASSAANLPVEALENAYSLRIDRSVLRAGSSGTVGCAVRDHCVLAAAVDPTPDGGLLGFHLP